MELSDNSGVRGYVWAVLTHPDGTCERYDFPNLVVDTGLNLVAERLLGLGVAVSHIAIGTGATAPSSGQTALVAEVDRVAFSSSSVVANVANFSGFYGAGVGTGTIAEAGIFNASTAGVMLNRALFPVAIPKGAGDTLTVNWQLTFS